MVVSVVRLLLEHEGLFDLISVTAGFLQSGLSLLGRNNDLVDSWRCLHRVVSLLKA